LRVVILAGGRSRRFGRDKLLARVGGRRVLARVVERVRPLASNLWISTSSLGRQRALARVLPSGLRWAIDRTDRWGDGPAGAMARLLSDLSEGPTLFLPGDLPWIETEALRGFVVVASRAAADVAAPVWGSGETEHLIVWVRRPGAVESLRSAMRRPDGSLRASEFLRAAPRTLLVPISRLTVRPGSFAHVTVPADLTRRRRRGEVRGRTRTRLVAGAPKRSYRAAHHRLARGETGPAARAFGSEATWYRRARLPLLAAHAREDSRATVNRV
jgi:molybdopterin-guanine dinucleotide biosynthesis protein A